MNPLDHADADWGHLFPQFAAALRATLDETAAATHEPWVLIEGYRSQARQLYLFAQGRTRPGRKVTWTTKPKWHGCGLAADVMPVHKAYAAPREWWEQLQAIGRRHGLHDPPWKQGDLGHLQLDVPENGAVHVAAQEWARKGFKSMPETPAPHPPIRTARLVVDGDERGYLTDNGQGHYLLEAGGEKMTIRNVCAGMGFPVPVYEPGPPPRVLVRTKG